MNRIIALAGLMFLCGAASRAETSEQTAAAADAKFVRFLAVDGAVPDNLARLPGGLFRGAALSGPEQYYYLRNILGVDLVVDLTEYPDDAEACKINGLGCAQFSIPLTWPLSVNLDWKTLRKAFYSTLDAQRRGERVYFHCEHGADRTGALAAALTVRREACGKSFRKDALWAEVDADLKRRHFHESWFPGLHQDIKNLVYQFDRNESWLCR